MGKKTKFLMLGILALMIITPLFAFGAEPLIPCGGAGQDPCTLCHLFDLAQTITNTLTTIIAPAIAVLAFSIGGFKILMSGPNPGYRAEGMKAIRNGVIGLIIVFGAWIIVNEFLLFVVGSGGIVKTGGTLMPWTKIQCIPAVEVKEEKPATGTGATGAACPADTKPVTCPTNGVTLNAQEVCDYKNSHETIKLELTKTGLIQLHGSNGLCDTIQKAVPPGSGKATCTSVAFLPNIPKLLALQKEIVAYCSNPFSTQHCPTHPNPPPAPHMTITGGTECGHQTHGFKKSAIDIRTTPLMNAFVRGTALKNGIPLIPETGPICEKYNILNATFTHEGVPGCIPTADEHWHVTY